MKIIYFDTETTGTDPLRNDIIDIAVIIEIDGKVEHEESIKMQPFDYSTIEQTALNVNGITVEELKTFQEPVEAYKKIIYLFGKYVDKFTKASRFYPAGYNCQFDLNFLASFFRKSDPSNKYGLGSWIQWCPFDMMQQLRNEIFIRGGKSPYENFKLKTVAEKHGLSFRAHDALEDIRVTRELIKRFIRHNQTGV